MVEVVVGPVETTTVRQRVMVLWCVSVVVVVGAFQVVGGSKT